MEGIVLFILSMVIGFFIPEILSRSKQSEKAMDGFVKIDDKNFIVNNELVSFEEDTPLLRWQQEREDNKHYREFVLKHLSADRQRIGDEFFNTIEAIRDRPQLKDCVTPEKLAAITEEYDKYLFKCKKLDERFLLSKEEFLIKEENLLLCMSLNFINPTAGFFIYEVSNENTAKYLGGNMIDMMKKQFEEEYYPL